MTDKPATAPKPYVDHETGATWPAPSPAPVQSAEQFATSVTSHIALAHSAFLQNWRERHEYFGYLDDPQTCELLAAYAASLHSNPDQRWIPVSERLPVEGE